jgi:hypothetical protein
MKLRLQITTPAGTTAFEHAGPVIRVGRDPACELALEGEAGSSVSRQHARIELAAEGATLTDTGSSNGTLLNDQLLARPLALRAGDRIQLGYTGPVLTVVELDLGAPPLAGSRRPWLGLGAGLAAAAAVALAVIWRPCPRAEPLAKTEPPDLAKVQPSDKGGEKPKEKEPPPPPPPPPPDDLPGLEVRDVGRYVSLPKWGPSVLLQRPGEAYPWTPLRPEDKVATGQTLVSLPGYRSLVVLDSGVHLELWGNVPEFAAVPPVLESVVMLHVPDTGLDLDFTLDRGRVRLANRKSSGPAHVRLRFLRETWDLTLPDQAGDVCVELFWGAGEGSAAGRGKSAAAVCVCLLTKGRISLRAGRQSFDLSEASFVSWLPRTAESPRPVRLKQLPDWWTKPPDRTRDDVALAMLYLQDWAKRFEDAKGDVWDTIVTPSRESPSPLFRALGLQFLAALDGIPQLVGFLEDRSHRHVRLAAADALRIWLCRADAQQSELSRHLQERLAYTREKADLALRLLHALPPEDVARPETYQELIGHLGHENLGIRELAWHQLGLLVPQVADQVPYDPAAEPEQRQQSLDSWRQKIPKGTVPFKSALAPDGK